MAYERYQDYESMKEKKAIFPETTAFQRYDMKTSEKAKMHLRDCSVRLIVHVPTLARTRHASVSMRIPGRWHVVVLVARMGERLFFECSVLISQS